MSRRFIHFFQAISPLHNGAGQGLGVLDRPIIREASTGYPFVQSSSIKGAYAALARKKEPALSAHWDAAFGLSGTDGNIGAFTFTDAALLLFPVRSLVGTMVWVTSALALARFLRFDGLAGSPTGLDAHLQKLLNDGSPGRGDALGAKELDQVIRIGGNGGYVVEGLSLSSIGDDTQRGHMKSFNQQLAAVLFPNQETESFWNGFLAARILLLHEDDFAHLVKHATEQEASIQITDEGVTKTGSLRYTEYLPSETIMFSFLSIDDPVGAVKGTDIESSFGKLPSELQIGADESKGKGLVRTVLKPAPKVQTPMKEGGNG